MGSRFPVQNASFAPIANSAAISKVLGNGSFQTPFPSFSYEDLGLNIKAKPTVNGDSDVSLQLEMQLRSLVGQSINGVPVIANQEYKGSITLRDGQPAVVAGALSRTDQRSLNGIPVLGVIPIVDSASKEVDDDELLIVVTPRVLRTDAAKASPEIWVSR
jgi:Flp pilus assembly secretin CpaC